MDLSTLASVTVTYRPELEVLRAQLQALPPTSFRVIVDNASPPESVAALRGLVAAGLCSTLIENPANLGLPAALNQGMRRAQQDMADCRYFLFLDQDTEPPAEGVAALLGEYRRLEAAGRNPGCVGPRLVDAYSGLQHGFHQMTAWRWVRQYPPPEAPPLECANLNCSGTLFAAELFDRLGGLDESFFMDQLDTEWSFRVLASGRRLYGVPAVTFRHRMGQATWRIWVFGWRIWPYRPPHRHYFVFRNGVRLMRRGYVPRVWKLWAMAKLTLTMSVHGLLDSQRGAQLSAMLRGIAAGLRS
jgi:rhamnosyltransferase